jgi:hypothetical protein
MPHTWVGSDFLNSLRSMFVYEDESRDALVLFAGVPEKWVREGEGISFKNFRTYYGTISGSARAEGDAIHISLSGDLVMPSGGLVVNPIIKTPVELNYAGKRFLKPIEGPVTIQHLPAEIILRPVE